MAFIAMLSGEKRAALLMLVSTVAFASMHGLVRNIGQELHPFEVAFFRNLFGLFALTPLFIRYGFAPLKTQRFGLLTLRALVNTVAMLCFFMALSLSPLATVSALGFSAPLFATLLAVLFLGEVVRVRRWIAIMVGFSGTIVILRPGIIELDLGMVLTLISSVVWAGALLIIKILSRTESSLTITAYMSILMMPLSLIPALFYWQWPTVEQLGWLVGIGIIGAFAQLTMTEALRLGDTSTVIPLDFFKLIWASIIGYFAFAEVPDLLTWVGGLMIFAGATYIVVRESELKKAKAEPK